MVKWMIEMMASGGKWFHCVIKLASPHDDFMSTRTQYWKNAANQLVHGKRWPRHYEGDLMRGIVMFEDARDGLGFVHVHVICCCPKGGDHTTLLRASEDLFKDEPVIEDWVEDGRFVGWKAYTERGDIVIREINTPDSIERAVDYATKELNWKSEQIGRWEFLHHRPKYS
jgi:hypothetical protein